MEYGSLDPLITAHMCDSDYKALFFHACLILNGNTGFNEIMDNVDVQTDYGSLSNQLHRRQGRIIYNRKNSIYHLIFRTVAPSSNKYVLAFQCSSLGIFNYGSLR